MISSNAEYAVADAGLKTQGMDHGNPSIEGATVRFLSDEHVTFVPAAQLAVGDEGEADSRSHRPDHGHARSRMAGRGDEVIDSWPIDLRGW